ncbi:diguanylate cyclase domain-containing protein [Bacillus infantis]|uniref:diguanylate cyclase domain-containing protein n=1 Tax=Bacillus infantis TaxID=324767 RepID=UPI0021559533|nr:diguanylate cyclase [Bacillus infantis]MCR6609780.1 diguanylate cyclase [Bacillus infantis]
MKLDKYKTLLFQKIKNQMTLWFEQEAETPVNNEDVYRFLHSIKGTAGTLQLVGLHQVAGKLMGQVEKSSEKIWENRELRDFLYELMGLSYEYEHFQREEEKQSLPRDENMPLIQVIDDDVSMLILLKDALESKGWMVMANTEPEKAVDQFFDMNPDCLIIDVNLPGKSGFHVLEDIQKHSNKKFIPKLMISIMNDRETRIKAYRLGADDFISKPIDLEEFLIRIERHLERKQIFDQSVLIDELTQVYNRRFLKDSLKRYLKELERNNQYFSIAVLDLDHFKQVNDKYGHPAGDRILSEFAQYLKDHVRIGDIVFRYGGEEFILLLPRTNDRDSKEVVSRLLSGFSSRTFQEGGEELKMTFSAGVYMVHDPSATVAEAIKTADQALYEAKRNGRARVESANKLIGGHSRKVLNVSVIDDDAIIRTMLMKILQSMEFEHTSLDIQVYEDGQKFLQSGRMEQKGEHFLILDGIMPVMDGTEVLQKVKENRNASRVHVLMLTGRKTEYDIARALKLGADDYVTKPFSITELQARIQRLIQRMS